MTAKEGLEHIGIQHNQEGTTCQAIERVSEYQMQQIFFQVDQCRLNPEKEFI